MAVKKERAKRQAVLPVERASRRHVAKLIAEHQIENDARAIALVKWRCWLEHGLALHAVVYGADGDHEGEVLADDGEHALDAMKHELSVTESKLADYGFSKRDRFRRSAEGLDGTTGAILVERHGVSVHEAARDASIYGPEAQHDPTRGYTVRVAACEVASSGVRKRVQRALKRR
jgi:hypothetical protein